MTESTAKPAFKGGAETRLSRLTAPRIRIGSLGIPPLFALVVVLPTLLALVYYLFLAAPMYVSVAQFVVRAPSHMSAGSLDTVLEGVGIGGATQTATDEYEVHEYIMSRDAVHDLEREQDLRKRLARPDVDIWARFPRPFEPTSFEALYRAYTRFVTVGYNSQTGISTLRVQAFTAEDASDIANALLDGGERLVNRLNDRAASDAVAEAKQRIDEAEANVAASETALTAFRNREQLIDPTRSSLANLDLISKLEGQLATLRAQRVALAGAAPKSPQLAELDRQIAAYQGQMADEQSKVAGQDTSLAPTIGEYERLIIDRDFAVRELTEASVAENSAQVESRRKRLYLERVVPPNTPDVATMPLRAHNVLMVLITSLIIYATITLVIAGLKEHGQA